MINRYTTAQPITSAEELLTLHDETFVRSAYLAVLNRPADPTGFVGLLEQVRSGADKEQLVAALATSAEGRSSKKTSELAGLTQLVEHARRNRPSLLIKILRRLTVQVLRPLSNQLRTTEQRLRELSDSTQARFDQLDTAIAALGTPGGLENKTSAQEREDLAQLPVHARDIYFQLKDAAAYSARRALS